MIEGRNDYRLVTEGTCQEGDREIALGVRVELDENSPFFIVFPAKPIEN